MTKLDSKTHQNNQESKEFSHDELRELWIRYRSVGIIPADETPKLIALADLIRNTAHSLSCFSECASTESWLRSEYNILRTIIQARNHN
jgi:hypothetical protein